MLLELMLLRGAVTLLYSETFQWESIPTTRTPQLLPQNQYSGIPIKCKLIGLGVRYGPESGEAGAADPVWMVICSAGGGCIKAAQTLLQPPSTKRSIISPQSLVRPKAQFHPSSPSHALSCIVVVLISIRQTLNHFLPSIVPRIPSHIELTAPLCWDRLATGFQNTTTRATSRSSPLMQSQPHNSLLRTPYRHANNC